MSRTRLRSPSGQLARLGFLDTAATARALEPLGAHAQALLPTLAAAADPDAAATGLGALAAASSNPTGFLSALTSDSALARHLTGVLGASEALCAYLGRHPEQWEELCDPVLDVTRPSAAALRASLLVAVGADPADEAPTAASQAESLDRLRVAYRARLLRLAARDLSGSLGLEDVAAELADLAGAALEAALAIARHRIGAEARQCRLAVIGLGKCGGRELNYVSDVDVLYVVEPVDGASESHVGRIGTRLAAELMRACSAHTGEGTLWPVDAALRPEGRAGPLVRTLHSHLAYCERWAKTWEFQALLKARPVAGDMELGRRYAAAVQPLVWRASEREGFVEDVQAMRRRVLEQVPSGNAGRELKLGPGGLRDVEFAVQLLQLVHGRTDSSLRSGTTLDGLSALTAGGYVGRDDGATLADAYRFLRALEHRVQLWHLRRTHTVPTGQRALRRLGRSLGFMSDPVAELEAHLAEQTRQVRRLHEKLFYRPLLAAVARLPGEEVRLSPQAAADRLSALGYLDADAALRHLEALTSGLSRRAAIQRTLLPVMLHWFATAPAPDAGLLAFRQVSEALGSTSWYLRLLRDEGAVAQRMATLLTASRYATDLLLRWPEAVAMLAKETELAPRSRHGLYAEMNQAAQRHDPTEAIASVRGVRRRELFRISAADVLGLVDVEDVGTALSELTAATVSAALSLALRRVEDERGEPLPTRIAVVAMGSLGAGELSYASDADVVFVHDPLDGADEPEASAVALAVVSELTGLLAQQGSDPPLTLDPTLRPEGRQGPLVRSLASYEAYYARWSGIWEAQALLRAEPLCGDPELSQRFVGLIDPVRWPGRGLSDQDVREIRRLKARMDVERLPRGADKATHLKLGRGGLVDVEWAVQLLQLQYANSVPALRTTRTLSALRAAEAGELLSGDDAETLVRAWRFASRIRNASVLARGRPMDSVPRDAHERAAVAYLCGYGPDGGERLVEDYLRSARRASAVIDRVFWT